ncbi:hypothetical protein Daus18300_008046 [Diaporthe australafricana]|uniref:Ankyrin repeat protein n=1 Tax=Diaporthe australafricana TaxID=127596 RepID=A0ABR3WJR4_9PEZI
MPLYGLFQDIIQKDAKKIDELVRIVQIVFCARRPLHPEELYVLLHQAYDVPFDPNETPDVFVIKHVLEVSKGLAEVTKSKEPTVQFIHETVREFLRDGGLRSISTQSVDRDGHETLKVSCLKQIISPVSGHLDLLAEYRRGGDYRNTRVHKVTKGRQESFREQANHVFPFLEYASRNVLFHANEAEAMGVRQRKFLESFPIQEWIPIHNLFEKFNKRRCGPTTPILYILAEHGCVHIIKNIEQFRGQYAQKVKANEFPSALSCAIYNGHLDTAWTMVGLDAKNRPPNIEVPLRGDYQPSLILLLLQLGDVSLTRKVLEDLHATNAPVPPSINLELLKSAEMIDLVLEMSLIVPEFPAVGYRHTQPQAGQEIPRPVASNTNLTFIRRAIYEDPRLLKSKAWGGKTMLDFAVKNRMKPLISLYIELSDGGQSDANAALHCAAKHDNFEIVRWVRRFNPNIRSQNENGRTALHLAVRFFYAETGDTIRYLLSEEPSCANVHDFEGITALAIAAQSHNLDRIFQRGVTTSIFEAFIEAGADANAMVKCYTCRKHQLPLGTHTAIHGDRSSFRAVACNDRVDLHRRDSFGRTALSWCFAYQHGAQYQRKSPVQSEFWQDYVGLVLLQQPGVDVNSRDDSGYTILEHFIRRPSSLTESFVSIFFQFKGLDSNLQTSDGQHPLELIITLYNTWPNEFGDIDSYASKFTRHTVEGAGEEMQQEFNKHLIQALEYLLGTGKVDNNVRLRCADQAAPELKSIILRS